MKQQFPIARVFAAAAAAAALSFSTFAWGGTVSPNDEASIITQLNSEGYIDVTGYKADSGGANLKAVKAATGNLVSVHVDNTGKMKISPGWPPQNPVNLKAS